MINGPFYSMYAVGEYTFAPFKVVWREQASDLTVAVAIGSEEPNVPIPDHKSMMIPCASPHEAYYLSGCLNNTVARSIVRGYVVDISTSTHILENIAIPEYDPSSAVHQCLVTCSRRAHEIVSEGTGEQSELRDIEAEIDRQVAKLWSLTQRELGAVQKGLVEIS